MISSLFEMTLHLQGAPRPEVGRHGGLKVQISRSPPDCAAAKRTSGLPGVREGRCARNTLCGDLARFFGSILSGGEGGNSFADTMQTRVSAEVLILL
jgi:hypothetical protein